jgi:hypothetical protein
MTDDGLFDMTPRSPFETGDRVVVATLWGPHHGIVTECFVTPDDQHMLVVAIDGVRHTVDPIHCTHQEDT